ncbi:MAG TPA: lipopolysaccharide heptosyltransferase family protein [candidate division Zixibacteria bacterium]|nr:lipopolysaccharide heptosyltransferase family protein [candidate division Zixibacteria bacterium]
MNLLKPIELLAKKMTLALLNIFRRAGRPESISINKGLTYKILFIRPQRIGDIFITFPVFDALLRQFPRAKISLFGSPACRPIIEDDPRFYKIYYYRKSIRSDFKELRKIRKEKYDCVVDLVGTDSVTSLLLTVFGVPGKPRIAVGKNRFCKYYDYNFDLRNGNTGHVIINSLKLLEAFGISFDKSDGFAPPYIDDNADRNAVEIFEKLSIDKNESFVVGYNLSAGSPERIPAVDVTADLLKRILNFRDNFRIILFALDPEREKAARLQEQFPEKVDIIPDGLSLPEASAVIKRLDFFITPDTSLVHIARSFEIPVVAFYRRYMDNHKIWYPFGQPCGAVVSGNEGNIADLTAASIFDEFVKVFDYFKQEGKCPISRLS